MPAIILISITSIIGLSFLQYSFENDFSYLANDIFMALIFIILPFFGGIFLLWKSFQTSKSKSLNSKNISYTDYSKNNDSDKTKFWVCPVCNGDFKEVDGKSYCQNCERYF